MACHYSPKGRPPVRCTWHLRLTSIFVSLTLDGSVVTCKSFWGLSIQSITTHHLHIRSHSWWPGIMNRSFLACRCSCLGTVDISEDKGGGRTGMEICTVRCYECTRLPSPHLFMAQGARVIRQALAPVLYRRGWGIIIKTL